MKAALGLIETVGKIAAVEAMDAAAKAADVSLTGLENSRGAGRMTVKIEGEVSAVKAAVEAAVSAVETLNGVVFAQKIIARPSDQLEKILHKTELDAVPPLKQATCNLCGDPDCKRIRGEARAKCIHYKKGLREQEEKK